MTDAVEKQRAYYEATAENYDAAHTEQEHVVALHLLCAFITMHGIRSVLDVGAGTGRAMRFLKARFPDLVLKGVEPVEALRKRGHAQGIPQEDLVAGDGLALPFPDRSFDLVCEFAVLHHVRRPEAVIAEMSRVASKMIAVSDCNFMGQGPRWLCWVKVSIWRLGLWSLASFIKTRGKGYTESQGDGIAYSYSVFQNLAQIRQAWPLVQTFPTAADTRASPNLLTAAGHLLIIGRRNLQRSEERA